MLRSSNSVSKPPGIVLEPEMMEVQVVFLFWIPSKMRLHLKYLTLGQASSAGMIFPKPFWGSTASTPQARSVAVLYELGKFTAGVFSMKITIFNLPETNIFAPKNGGFQ